MIELPTEPLHRFGVVLLTGMVYGLYEVLLHATVAPFLSHRFKAAMEKPDDREARLNSKLALGRVIGWTHNSIQVVLGLIVLTDPVMRADTIFASTRASRAVMLIAAGFFAYDIVHCTRHLKDDGWEYLIHALLCGAGYTGAFVYDKLHYFGSAYIMWECSSFFVHARWFLYLLGHGKSRAYDINAKLLFLTFFFCRIVWGTYITVHFWTDLGRQLLLPQPALGSGLVALYRVVALLANSLNYYWFKLMVGKVMAVVVKGKNFHEVSKKKDT